MISLSLIIIYITLITALAWYLDARVRSKRISRKIHKDIKKSIKSLVSNENLSYDERGISLVENAISQVIDCHIKKGNLHTIAGKAQRKPR